MVVVSTYGRQDTEENIVLGMDFSASDRCLAKLHVPFCSPCLVSKLFRHRWKNVRFLGMNFDLSCFRITICFLSSLCPIFPLFPTATAPVAVRLGNPLDFHLLCLFPPPPKISWDGTSTTQISGVFFRKVALGKPQVLSTVCGWCFLSLSHNLQCPKQT